MAIAFSKMSGAGNDFVVIDHRDGKLDATPTFISKVCARRMSVGADGLLLVEPPENPNEADFRMRYYNADGGEAETCGNGARCIARFAYLRGMVGESIRFETLAGVYTAKIVGEHVRIGMGDPNETRLDVPVALRGGTRIASFSNTGVPHVVYFTEDLDAEDVVAVGRETRYHTQFAPTGTNANFARIVDSDTLCLRTYERGVEDETLACGTGAIAAATTAALLGKATPPVSVWTASRSKLTIHFEIDGNATRNVQLEGDARIIYTGELQPDAWEY